MASNYVQPYNFARAITTSDTVDFPPAGAGVCSAMRFRSARAGRVRWCSRTIRPCAFTLISGQVLPISAKRVNATGTAALLLVALYMI